VIRAAWLVVPTIVALTACSGTDSTVQPGATTGATAATTTLLIEGSASELLPEMAVEMSRLSAQVAEDGNFDDATLATILAIWAVAKPEVEATRPELVVGFDTTVVMATSAVERKRPADADKAFNLLTDLVDSYTGDG
jgi:hypothetical protein